MTVAQGTFHSDGRLKRVGSLIDAMWASLRGYWTEAEGYQKFVYMVGGLMFVSALFHTGVFLFDDMPWEGPVSWRKPIVFGVSLGSTLLSLAWVLHFLPKRRRLNWWLMGILGTTMTVEYGLIVMQVWRGVPSHFNYTTPFNAAVFSVMGIMIAIFALICLIITGLVFFTVNAPPSMVWAIRIGLLILAISQFIGYAIVQNGTAQAFSESGQDIRDVTQTASTIGAAGNIKVPHAITLHALQVLPILAWLLLFSTWRERQRLLAVLVAGAGYMGLVALSLIQTFSGHATFDLSLLTSALLAISIASIIGAYLAALWALQQSVATNDS
ncbi:MAG: hypothetical protein ACPGWR_29985 [Ardenticatenaceae bacterium]